jgi:hypothetical protein
MSVEMEVNRRVWPIFCHWILSEVKKRGYVPLGEAIDGGAMVAGCSQQATKRYLSKLTSPQGFLELSEPQRGFVCVESKKSQLPRQEKTKSEPVRLKALKATPCLRTEADQGEQEHDKNRQISE